MIDHGLRIEVENGCRLGAVRRKQRKLFGCYQINGTNE